MHYFIATYVLFSSIFIFCADSLLLTTDVPRVLKEHRLDDSRLQTVFVGHVEEYIIDTVLRPCINPKLSYVKIFDSLNDANMLHISCNTYYGLMCITMGQYDKFIKEIHAREEVGFGIIKSKKQFDQLNRYLWEGFDYQVIKAAPRYYIPFISWVSKQSGVELPRECYEKILSYIDILPYCALCEIF